MIKLPKTSRRELLIKSSASLLAGTFLAKQVLASDSDLAQDSNLKDDGEFRMSAASNKFMSMFDLNQNLAKLYQ